MIKNVTTKRNLAYLNLMRKAKVVLGVFFLIIGVSTSVGSVYLLQEDRIIQLFDTNQDLKLEITLLLLFSLLLCYSGYKTIQKEYKEELFEQSELLDD
jgi:hypothetical protein